MTIKSLVEVTWKDADCDSGWLEDDPVGDQEVQYMKAYGLLVSKGSEFVTLSFLYEPTGKYWLGKHRIPVENIKSIRLIEEVNVGYS